MEFEEWKKVVGHPNYKVSNFGRVKSISRWVRYGNGKKKLKESTLLKPALVNGYQLVGLGSGITKTVHSLVAEAFLGPKPEGYEINHKDTVRSNNHYKNLEYMTHQENMIHAAKMAEANGTNFPGFVRKLDEEKVKHIRYLQQEGESMVKLAKRFGVSYQTILGVVHNRTWTKV
jgi:hypothetical protein